MRRLAPALNQERQHMKNQQIETKSSKYCFDCEKPFRPLERRTIHWIEKGKVALTFCQDCGDRRQIDYPPGRAYE
jgi:hypothetical protein